MTLEFLGAAGTVTGSMHLLTTESGSRVLLDCGLYQGRRKDARRINSELPFDPSSLDAVILSHAHIDHSGNLPSLVAGDRKGRFRGRVHATHATRDLCSIMLPDSAHIQESDAAYLRRKGRTYVPPIYTQDDAYRLLERFVCTSYQTPEPITRDITCTFFDAGHILGSSLVVLDVQETGGSIRLCFTGDLGRPGRPILRDPVHVGDVDVLISESTYGGRHHESFPDLKETLCRTIGEVTERGGKVVIPAFAIGRTQDIVYLLNLLFEEGRLPRVPIYVDSPLAINATDIFRTHPECFNQEVLELLQSDDDPFGFGSLRFLRKAEESKALNGNPEPCVIIAASGMMEAGRVVHHLMNTIEDPRNMVLVVGFQAEHTLGRRIVERRERVSIMGKDFRLRAEVKTINGLSAHADHDELVDYIGRMNHQRLRNIFLVHGEPEASAALREGLIGVGFKNVVAPNRGNSFTIKPS